VYDHFYVYIKCQQSLVNWCTCTVSPLCWWWRYNYCNKRHVCRGLPGMEHICFQQRRSWQQLNTRMTAVYNIVFVNSNCNFVANSLYSARWCFFLQRVTNSSKLINTHHYWLLVFVFWLQNHQLILLLLSVQSSNAIHGQNINLPSINLAVCVVCLCVCVHHTFCQLAYYRSDPSTDFYSW